MKVSSTEGEDERRRKRRRKRRSRRGTFIRVEEWRLILLSGMGGRARNTAPPSISLFGPDAPPPHTREIQEEIESFQVDFHVCRISSEQQCEMLSTAEVNRENDRDKRGGRCESVVSDVHPNYGVATAFII